MCELYVLFIMIKNYIEVIEKKNVIQNTHKRKITDFIKFHY